jgi:uncharacterized protein (TIGR02117 family)
MTKFTYIKTLVSRFFKRVYQVIYWPIKIVLHILELVTALITTYIVLAILGMSIHLGELEKMKSNESIELYLKTDGIHTDFILPVKTKYHDWTSTVPWSAIQSKDTTYPYISFGWGDQGFFLNTPTWAELKFSTAFDALFYRGKSALHISYRNAPDLDGGSVKLRISGEKYKKLIQYIHDQFKHNADGSRAHIPNRGYWDADTFYEAKGKYSLFSTCNSWINRGLSEADLPHCLWTPFSAGIFGPYRK